MNKVKMFKKDAIIDIQVGTSFIQKLNAVLLFLGNDKGEADLEKYKQEASAGQGFTEDWMQHVTTLGILLKEIETKADTQGHTYEKEMENVIDDLKSALPSEFPTEEEN